MGGESSKQNNKIETPKNKKPFFHLLKCPEVPDYYFQEDNAANTNQLNSQIQNHTQEELNKIKAENERLQREKEDLKNANTTINQQQREIEREKAKLESKYNEQSNRLNKYQQIIEKEERNEVCASIAKTNGLNQGDSNDQRTINLCDKIN